MARVKKRIFAGAVCQQIVYNVSDRAAEPTKAKPKKPRFESAEERAEFNRQIARRRFARDVNANFTPRGYYVTLTFDIEHELHTFDDARRVRDNYIRRLLRACPEGRGFIVMGRGKSTNRIHMHMICEGISPEIIRAKWGLGEVVAVSPLREHNFYNGIDCGQDYTALAYYCFDHWTQEQGGHRYKRFGELRHAEEEEPTEARIDYRPERPPIAPKGYRFMRVEYNRYGYMCFHYVRDRRGRGRTKKE